MRYNSNAWRRHSVYALWYLSETLNKQIGLGSYNIVVYTAMLKVEISSFRVCLIATWKMKIKIVYFCKKLESKLRHVMRWYSFLWVDILYPSLFLVEFFFSQLTKKIFSWKNHKLRRHLISCLNLFSNFLQKYTIFIFLYHVVIKHTLS